VERRTRTQLRAFNRIKGNGKGDRGEKRIEGEGKRKDKGDIKYEWSGKRTGRDMSFDRGKGNIGRTGTGKDEGIGKQIQGTGNG
jgi:hypothetical protein